MADFTPGTMDVVYDPVNDDFKNLTSGGTSIGLEHSWNRCLSTTIGGSFVDFDLPEFVGDQTFDHGHKALTNLIWRPKGQLDGLTMGVEWVYASRSDKDGRSTQANRLILAGWYDFNRSQFGIKNFLVRFVRLGYHDPSRSLCGSNRSYPSWKQTNN